MKQCNNCGIEISDEADFCPSCGKPVADAPARAEPIVFAGAGARENGVIPPKIESHLVKAIISTVCCCLPFGIVAIVYAAQVGTNLRANNFEAALEASKKAGLWGNLSIGIGVILQIIGQLLLRLTFNDAFSEFFRAYVNG